MIFLRLYFYKVVLPSNLLLGCVHELLMLYYSYLPHFFGRRVLLKIFIVVYFFLLPDTLCMNTTISPSCITYVFPSCLYFPASFTLAILA